MADTNRPHAARGDLSIDRHRVGVGLVSDWCRASNNVAPVTYLPHGVIDF
jgi:hypothetical protein